MDTKENMDWKIPKGTPVMIFTVIKNNTTGIFRSSKIFLALNTLSLEWLLSETEICTETYNIKDFFS